MASPVLPSWGRIFLAEKCPQPMQQQEKIPPMPEAAKQSKANLVAASFPYRRGRWPGRFSPPLSQQPEDSSSTWAGTGFALLFFHPCLKALLWVHGWSSHFPSKWHAKIFSQELQIARYLLGFLKKNAKDLLLLFSSVMNVFNYLPLFLFIKLITTAHVPACPSSSNTDQTSLQGLILGRGGGWQVSASVLACLRAVSKTGPHVQRGKRQRNKNKRKT